MLFSFAFILAVSISGKSQTMPNMYPAYWLGKQFKSLTANHHIATDTSIKPIRKCIEKDSCRQRKHGKNVFINRDSSLRKQVLKTWRY